MVVALAVAATGCSGVPSSSAPQIVSTVGQNNANAPELTLSPALSDDPRHIVSKFLTASADKDELHQEAKQFLVRRAAWNSSTATILSDSGYRVSNPDPKTHNVTVTGEIVGKLDTDGVYSPAAATPTSTSDQRFVFTMARTSAGWRIKQPPVGLILRQQDFASSYAARPIFFYNQDESRLVPDLRYSALQGQSLATWLLAKVLDGPPASPQAAAVRHNEVSSELDTGRAKVTVGAATVAVQLPGINQSDAGTAARIAAQLAYTMYPPLDDKPLQLNDVVGAARGVPERFDVSTYPSFAPLPPGSAQQLFYVRNGAVVDSADRPIAGEFGTARYRLRSVATGPVVGGSRAIAGVGMSTKTLVVRNLDGSVRLLRLPAPATSRPDWSTAGPREVWIGAGARLVRAVGSHVTAVPYTATGGVALPGVVASVRFSPDGARVALILQPKGSSAVWIGQVSRTGNTVQLVDLRRVTPPSWYGIDVTWSSAVQLRLIDSQPFLSNFNIWSVRPDGSGAQQLPVGNLPGPPLYITSLLTDQPLSVTTWVSVENTLWRDEGGVGNWEEPSDVSGQPAIGTAPQFSA